MSCCGQRAKSTRTTQTDSTREPGKVVSAETFVASAQPRYEVVARRTDTSGKRFSTLTAAQDHAKRSGGLIRQL
jgi:hypothetical protein